MKTQTVIAWAICIGAVVLGAGYLVLSRPSSDAQSASTTPLTTDDPASLAGINTGAAPWAPEIAHLADRLAADGLPKLTMEGEVLHIHQHLDLYVDGAPVAVPALIGINEAAGWLSPIHVHDTTGIIHVESPFVATFTLGEFFDIWDVRFTQSCMGGYCADESHALRVYVNGKLYQGDPRQIALAAHQEIAVTYGTATETPAAIPSAFDFPQGY